MRYKVLFTLAKALSQKRLLYLPGDVTKRQCLSWSN